MTRDEERGRAWKVALKVALKRCEEKLRGTKEGTNANKQWKTKRGKYYAFLKRADKLYNGHDKPTHGLPLVIQGNGTIRELPLDELYTKYNEHERLRVFANNGLKCAWPGCTHIGSKLIVTVDLGGKEHIDLFTEDFALMTVDHIHPKSAGGEDTLENTQPMCLNHNMKKGSIPMNEITIN